MAISTAARFITGNAPGRARTTGSMSELGGAASNSGCAGLGQRENILVHVASSTCTSRPTLSFTDWIHGTGNAEPTLVFADGIAGWGKATPGRRRRGPTRW